MKEMDTKTRRLAGKVCEKQRDGRSRSERQKAGGYETTICMREGREEGESSRQEADWEINGCRSVL